ncbi:hypothetical protein COO91_05614 [Nostoc flagelliforme CCNUN1]|uniref:Uncharacterized protein n=1 Tax=Nostoc flagelliforme CCNUN1 TaxID=2038116 RepID=A0A2K8SVY1_9NOSO|nr:hypothetical protein COO91_05614 [Nostoc flagelliforme CCNUN1]
MPLENKSKLLASLGSILHLPFFDCQGIGELVGQAITHCGSE